MSVSKEKRSVDLKLENLKVVLMDDLGLTEKDLDKAWASHMENSMG